MIQHRVLGNDYQWLVPLRQRDLGMTGAWEEMASAQSPFLVSVASLMMLPPRLIFFCMVLMPFRKLHQLVNYTAANCVTLTFYISCIVSRLLR